MGRQPCCQKVGIKKGPWTAKEDKKLVDFILTNGHCCWRTLPKLAGLLRCGQSCMLCMLRWTNYLRPDLKRGLLSESEEKMVINLHSQLGNRWSKIASHLPDRTDNEIKTHIKKILRKMGIDPLTHKPISPTSPYIDEHEGPAKLSDDKKHEKRFDDTINIQSPQTVTEQMVQEFDLSEVPMIQPNELMAPSLTSSSTTTNSCSNSSSTTNAEESQLPCNIDWKESMHMWGLDGNFMEWGSFSIYMQPAPVDFALIKSHGSLSSFDFI